MTALHAKSSQEQWHTVSATRRRPRESTRVRTGDGSKAGPRLQPWGCDSRAHSCNA